MRLCVCGAPQGEIAGFMTPIRQQIDRALADARAHGFHPSPVRVVPGVDHGPLPVPVLAWIDSLEQAKR